MLTWKQIKSSGSDILVVNAVTMASLSSIITIGVCFVCQAPLTTGNIFEDNQNIGERFKQFMVRFGKTGYSSMERVERFKIYKHNLEIIRQLNNDEEDAALYGETMFSDLTTEEFKLQFLLPYYSFTPKPSEQIIPESAYPTPHSRPQIHGSPATTSNSTTILKKAAKDFFSWIENNPFYPPVEDQGRTNFSGAFAVIGALSILYSVQQKQKISLSKQQYLDCDESIQQSAIMDYLTRNDLAVEADYPFRPNGTKGKCDKTAVAEGVAGLEKYWIPRGTNGLAEDLRKSPIVGIVTASRLQHYQAGIITDCPIVSDANLAVVIVEHGLGAGRRGEVLPYYLLRTSWGPEYGTEEGHVRIRRDTCGIERKAYALKLKTKSGCFSGICKIFKRKN